MGVVEKILNSKPMERFRRTLALKSGIYCKIKRLSASAHDDVRTVKLLQHFNIDTVIDVGANTGQFAESLIDFGYKGRIISFEPVGKVHAELLKRAKRYDNWDVAEQCAIGAEDGEAELNVSESTVFSSLLKIKDDYVASTNKSRIVATEKVAVYKLDTILAKYVDVDTANVLLKIDTQGFEREVILGAKESIKKLKGIKTEIPLFSIYNDSQWTFYDFVEYMKGINYRPYAFSLEGVNWKTGRMNTIDGIFFPA